MDHRVAKDMISSGMIPSGEKKKEDLSRPQYGTVPSPNALADAYKSMYDKKEEVINEHHQKDKDGNTIPHEDEEIKESGDVFDTVVNHFLNEGYQREDIIKAMSTVHLTEEQLLQEDFGLSAIIAGTAAALAKGAAVAGKVAAVGGKAAAAAAKGGMAAAKGVGTATKGIISAAKPVVGAATKGLTNVGTKVGQTAGKVGTKVSQTAGKVGQKVADTTSNVGQQVKKVATTAKDNVGQKIQNIAQGTGTKPTSQTPQTPQQKTVKQKVIDYGKRKAREKGEEELMKDRPLQKTNKTGVAHAGQTDIAASADLFDIVKGRLLDEGLSEEEIKDIMLTLTADEILNEMGDYPMGKGANYRETPKPNKPEPKPGEDGSRYDAKGRKRYNPANYNRLSGKTSKFDESTTPTMEELSDTVKRNDAINKANAMKRAKESEVPENVRAAQRRQNTAGGPKDKGENKYTTQDKKTIIDYNKNRESM